MGSIAACILIALIILLTICTLAFGLLVQRTAHTPWGIALVIVGVALGVAMLVDAAWNAGSVVPPPTNAGAALVLIAFTDATTHWLRREGSGVSIAPWRMEQPIARSPGRFHIRHASRFLPAP
jgi:hypothetical protein